MGEILASRKPETLCNHSIHQSFSPNSILSFHILLIIEPDHNKLVSERLSWPLRDSVCGIGHSISIVGDAIKLNL